MSLDQELGSPSIVTPSALKILRGDACVHMSTHVKCLVHKLRYDGFQPITMFVKVLEELEPRCFENPIGQKNWKVAWMKDGILGCKPHLGFNSFALAKIYAQTYGINDYEETLNLIARMETWEQ